MRSRCIFIMTLILLLLAVVGCALGVDISPPIPVDDTEPGIRYNPATVEPKVTLEMFIDLNCYISAAGLPVVQQVAGYYGNDKLDLVIQQLPLPYHRNAFLSTQGLYLIVDNLPASTFAYIEAVLARADDFSTANTVNMTETEVLDMLADIAVSSTGIDKDFFKANIRNYRGRTSSAWKYAVSRLQAATPSYSVNGVDLIIADSDAPSFEEWITFLDPIVNEAYGLSKKI